MFEIPLFFPITVNGQKVEKLTMRRGTVKDMRMSGRVSQDPEEREIALFGILTGLAPEDVEQMDLSDYGQLQDKFVVMTKGPVKKSPEPSQGGDGNTGDATFPVVAGSAGLSGRDGVPGAVVGIPAV